MENNKMNKIHRIKLNLQKSTISIKLYNFLDSLFNSISEFGDKYFFYIS